MPGFLPLTEVLVPEKQVQQDCSQNTVSHCARRAARCDLRTGPRDLWIRPTLARATPVVCLLKCCIGKDELVRVDIDVVCCVEEWSWPSAAIVGIIARP